MSTDELLEEIKGYFSLFAPEVELLLLKALEIMLSLHQHQAARQDGPYINHVLRVTLRILRWGAKNSEEIISALWHDVLEDQVRKLVFEVGGFPESSIGARDLQKEGRKVIERFWGNGVMSNVSLLTTPDLSAAQSAKEWNKRYATHVETIIVIPICGRIKLSDFCDNGLGLDSVLDTATRHRYCRKYYPLFDIFISALQNGKLSCGDSTNEVLADLSAGFDYIKSQVGSQEQLHDE